MRSWNFFCVGVWEVKNTSYFTNQRPEPWNFWGQFNDKSISLPEFLKKNLVGGTPTSLPNGQTKILLLRIVAASLEKATAVFGLFRGFSGGWFWDRWLQQKNSVDQRPRENGVGEGNYSGWTPLIHTRWETRRFFEKKKNEPFQPPRLLPFPNTLKGIKEPFRFRIGFSINSSICV